MYFADIKTIDELNARYKKLSKVLHPDMGGSDEAFKALKTDFDNRKEQILNPQQAYEKRGQKQPTQAQQPQQTSIFSDILSNPQVQNTIKTSLDAIANDLVSNLKSKIDEIASQNNHKK